MSDATIQPDDMLRSWPMSAPDQTTAKPVSTGGPGRRVAACVLVSAIVFLALWVTAFTLVASFLISMCVGVVLVAASSVSELVEMVLDTIATVIFAIFAAIAAIFAALFSLLG
jgi:hypothetical protein